MTAISKTFKLLPQQQRVAFLLVTISRILLGFVDLAGIALIGLLGVLAFSPQNESKTFSFIGIQITFSNNASEIGRLVLLTFGLFAIKATFTVLFNRANYRLAAKIDSKMNQKLGQVIFFGDYAALRLIPKTRVQWLLLEGVKQAFSVTLTAASSLIVDSFSLIIIGFFLFLVDPIASLIAVVYFGFMVLITQLWLGRFQKKVAARQINFAQKAWASVEDGYSAYKEYFVRGLLERAVQKFVEPFKGMVIEISNDAFLKSIPKVVSELSLMLGILGFVAWQIFAGTLEQSIGILSIFMVSGLKIMGALGPIQASIATLKSSSVQGEKVLEILSAGGEQVPTYKPLSDSKSMYKDALERNMSGLDVNVTNVSYRFLDSNTTVLNDISFQIQAGDFVAFIGPSGAGKTTLIDLILGLYQPNSGNILIDGIPVDELLRKNPGTIAYVPQRPGLITGTLRENITLNEPEELFDIERFNRALKISHLQELVSKLPNGDSHIIDGPNANLSGGQMQRVGLARAIYSSPRLLVLDEATSALDAETEYFITQGIESLRPDVTVIVVAHRLSTVQNADVVFVVEDGKITDSGKFSYLKESHPLVQEYVKIMTL